LPEGPTMPKLIATFLMIALALGAGGTVLSPLGAAAAPKVSHGLTLMDKLKYGPDFKHLAYVNPDAPKGGLLRRFTIGTFDSFNPFIIKGNPAAGLGFTFETLMTSSPDEISAEYGLIAGTVEVPDDLSYVIYNLRPEARFHDGKPITADDVIYSFNLLKKKGQPFYRFYYANISKAVKLSPHKVRFDFTGPPNRELPQITGQLPVLPKHYWEARDFSKSTLKPPLGSGPYKLSKFEPGRSVEYERVKDYWGRNLPINRGRYNFDRIRFEYYRDQTVALEAFKKGRYDFRRESSSLVWATGYDFPNRRNGLVATEEVTHARPTGMQGFVFNTRRAKFRDPALRRALAYAFDFEWSNKNLFHGQYTRTKSYFSNTELAARKLPGKAELALLEPLRGKIPDEVFTTVYEPPANDGSGSIRRNLRAGTRILRKAGWRVKDGKLIDPSSGKPLSLEILLVSPQFERIVSPFIQNLKRLGVAARARTVDQSQYINRVRAFDFDVIVGGWGQSESPGNEQRDFWSTSAAGRQGSRNTAGIKDEAIDSLIESIVAARDRNSLVHATRALDRVLLWSHFVIPQWHARFDRIAYWNMFGRTAKHPKYGPDIMSWWIDPSKVEKLSKRVKDVKRK
jgi:microcin C transport system substrate-binding protein